MKPKPGDISIVENVGTFLMWYDNDPLPILTFALPSPMLRVWRSLGVNTSSTTLFRAS